MHDQFRPNCNKVELKLIQIDFGSGVVALLPQQQMTVTQLQEHYVFRKEIISYRYVTRRQIVFSA
jgi:hypothetical protein